MSKNKFTGTATQPQCNRKFCQFNKDQYCNWAQTFVFHVIEAGKKEINMALWT